MKIEAGKISVRPAEFDLGQPLGSLRGYRLLAVRSVEEARALDPIETENLQAGGARVIAVQEMLRDEAARALRAAVWEAGGANA